MSDTLHVGYWIVYVLKSDGFWPVNSPGKFDELYIRRMNQNTWHSSLPEQQHILKLISEERKNTDEVKSEKTYCHVLIKARHGMLSEWKYSLTRIEDWVRKLYHERQDDLSICRDQGRQYLARKQCINKLLKKILLSPRWAWRITTYGHRFPNFMCCNRNISE